RGRGQSAERQRARDGSAPRPQPSESRSSGSLVGIMSNHVCPLACSGAKRRAGAPSSTPRERGRNVTGWTSIVRQSEGTRPWAKSAERLAIPVHQFAHADQSAVLEGTNGFLGFAEFTCYLGVGQLEEKAHHEDGPMQL